LIQIAKVWPAGAMKMLNGTQSFGELGLIAFQ
jgi:hypothetical protein